MISPATARDTAGAGGAGGAGGAPAARPTWRSVAVPAEHGGWGLTLEPGLLGLLLVPGWAGLCLALAAVVAFLARTPARVVAVDLRRGRRLERTRVAARVAAAEAVVLVLLVAAAAALGTPGWWVPAVVALPLVAVEAAYEVRSRARRLVPELAGSVAVASVAAMVVLAGGGGRRLAAGAWLVLAARAATSIPHVRGQIAALHHRPAQNGAAVAGDLAALALGGLAACCDPGLVPGALGVAAVVVVQRLAARRPPPRPAVIGVRQMTLGVALVAVTATGAALA